MAVIAYIVLILAKFIFPSDNFINPLPKIPCQSGNVENCSCHVYRGKVP